MAYSQKKEANRKFSDFIKKNYSEWSLNNNGPTMSHTLLKESFPYLNKEKVFFIVLDNSDMISGKF